MLEHNTTARRGVVKPWGWVDVLKHNVHWVRLITMILPLAAGRASPQARRAGDPLAASGRPPALDTVDKGGGKVDTM